MSLASPEFALMEEGRAAATIVVAEGQDAPASALRDGLREALGADFATVTHDEVMQAGNWRLKPEWLDRPLILVGNIENNRAMFALFSRFLEGANAAYPGAGRYVLRVLFQPLQRGVPMLCVGASDPVGLDAAVARLVTLAGEQHGVFRPLVEVGDASGPVSRSTRFAGDFISAVSPWYWKGDAGAGQRARELLMAEASKPGNDLWGFLEGGHYDWERYYRPLRQLLASGLLPDEERRQVEERLVAIALESTDWAGLVPLRLARGGMTNALSRHPISGLIGHYILYEYLDTIGDVPADKREAITQGHARLREHIESLIEAERFMSNQVGTQGVDNLSFMAGMYLLLGDGRVVERNILSRMADFYLAGKDNLGYQAGDDAYITCRPGAHRTHSSGGLPLLLAAYFHRDGQYRWLLDNTHHFMSHMSVPQPPEIAGLVQGIPPEPPSRHLGLNLLPLDSWWYRRCADWQPGEMMTPIQAPLEDTFTKAVFRDGYNTHDAYLLLQGVNLGGPAGGEGFSANSVIRYTELGSILLYANTIKQTSWARSVVSASRGEADPQSTACVRAAHFSTPLVSGLESIQDNEGGLSWARSIIRRARGYFVVLDALTAREEDTYNLTCRWRSFHPGELTGDRRFMARDGMLGVTFHLQGAAPASWQAEPEPIDGAARPTMIRQFQRLRLQAGEKARFNNLFYASDGDHPRAFEMREWTTEAVLVRGETSDFRELAGIGTGPLTLKAVTAGARLWYVSGQCVVLAGVTRVRLPGTLELEADDDITIGFLPGDDATWIENPHARPIRLVSRLADAPTLRLNGEPLRSTAELPPGRHRLEADLGALFGQAQDELEALWAASRPSEAPADPAPPAPQRFEFTPVWRTTAAAAEYRRHADVLATAEPPTQIGSPASWRDALLGPPGGYGWHSSERAGWLLGTEGTVVLDLGHELDIRELRLVRSRGPQYSAPHFSAEGYSFTLALSNDGFRQDVRRRAVTEPGLDVLYRENAHYMYTMRFPVLVVPVGERARYVRVTPRRALEVTGDPAAGYARGPDGRYSGLLQDKETSFMEIEVVREDREGRLPAGLWCDSFGAADGPRVLYQAGSRIVMLSPTGEMLWDRDLGAPPAADVVLADTDGDGREEIITFTLAGSMAAHDLAGNRRFEVDIRAATRDEETGGYCSARPACLAAWRPDAAGNLEYLFFPHYTCYRVSPAPELAVSRVEHPGGHRGGKFAFTVPDVTGDGREELAVVGLYGFSFGVIPSETPLERNELPSYLGLAPLTGYSSGNQEHRLYHDGAVVRDGAGTWLGVVAINPGGIDFFGPTDFRKRWAHFNHPPNLCSVLADLNADGIPELLVGREDGYLVAYEVEEGKVVARAALDGAVRSLAVLADSGPRPGAIVAGTERGLALLDASLELVGHLAGPVEAVAVLARAQGEPLVVAADPQGAVTSYRIVESR